MCGILGVITKDGEKDLSQIDTGALKNRGPDSSANYIDKRIGFYHTRLAVIDDRATSDQPIASSCGNLVLICNGEIYNNKELKERYPYDYKTTSDCEVILALYKKEGVKGFERLKGMFSFGLYDKAKNKVILYRDAVGKKPLFYYHDKDIFIFSSSLKAIKDNISVGLKINRAALLYYLENGFIRPDISFYEGIAPILPGSLLEMDIAGGDISASYMAPESTSYSTFQYDWAHIGPEVDRLLSQSIERRMEDIERPVLLFSGGIDSTVLAKAMSRRTKAKLVCIGLKPLVPFTYDEFYGIYAAKKLHLQYIPVSLELNNFRGGIGRAISLLDQPLAVYSYYLLTYLTRKAREFGNVLFLGEGGDEVFYGYKDIRDWFLRNSDELSEDGYEVGPRPQPGLSAWAKRQIRGDLLGHSFVKVDKATAEQGMEARCPYLDWDLMYFARKIPPTFFIESKTPKVILKKLLDDFPSWFINRKKVGFGFNFRYLAAPHYKEIYNEIDFERLADLGVPVDSGRFSYGYMFREFDRLWKLYVLSGFLKER